MPEISVVIPTYNRFEMLEKALNSVLSQNFKDFEILVVDDASADNTNERMQNGFEAEIEKGVIRYIRNRTEQGRSACRNTGIKFAQAGLISFLDDDDCWLQDHLGSLYAFINEHKDIGIAFSNWETIDEQSQKKNIGIKGIMTGTGDAYLKLMLRALIGYPSTCIIRISLLEETHGFNVKLPPREDWELFTRCAMKGGVGFIDKTTVQISVHAGSYSRNKIQWVNATEAAWNSITASAQENGIKLGNKIISERALRLSRAFITIGGFDKAKEYLFEAIRHRPSALFSSIATENAFKLIIGKSLYMRYKK
ncbi:MAG: glycosyltransferase [Deltaproteobacteria bacterium]|nr:glycosyltransferase [Deltaproteobacteria bacterium]